MGSDEQLPGPTPTLFFAPDHAVSLFKTLGPAEAGKQLAASWGFFLEAAAGTVAIERHAGLSAAKDTYVTMISGDINPAQGIVIEP